MENLSKKTLLSHLHSYKLTGYFQTIGEMGLNPTILAQGETVQVIFSADASHIAAIGAEQDKIVAFLKEKEPQHTYKILLNHHLSSQAAQKPKQTPASKSIQQPQKVTLPHMKHLIAVTSGKGGVGKSMVAVNLAVSLQQKGLKVGVLDLDIYGPSVPTLLRLDQEPQKKEGKLIPLDFEGMPVLSMGLLIPAEKAVIWRGPLIQKTVHQFLVQTSWPDLDILILDTPPGTGDVHLSLAQIVPLTGVIVVSTPQKLAVIDARKSLEMFETLGVPVLGLVENMSAYQCASCGHTAPLFNRSAFSQLHAMAKLPLLAQIPFDAKLQESAESGVPFVKDTSHVTAPLREVFAQMATKMLQLIRFV